jgi:hypothetical protein
MHRAPIMVASGTRIEILAPLVVFIVFPLGVALAGFDAICSVMDSPEGRLKRH